MIDILYTVVGCAVGGAIGLGLIFLYEFIRDKVSK